MVEFVPVEHDPWRRAYGTVPVDHDPFEDTLVPPPRNPMAPPQGISDAVRGAVKHNLDWAKVPGRIMQGVTRGVPGQWSETDEWRQQQLDDAPYHWGPATAVSEVFWPRTGTNVGGSGFSVGSGAVVPPKQGFRLVPVDRDPFKQ